MVINRQYWHTNYYFESKSRPMKSPLIVVLISLKNGEYISVW
jgi:hypothetical protein